ncbi:putative RNA-directed DNA polymerase from transposon X-element [Trichonephila clavipes]|nr:putative RNA-directed DNA polymerase from transposon X-element [Trichonephila clavipes]
MASGSRTLHITPASAGGGVHKIRIPRPEIYRRCFPDIQKVFDINNSHSSNRRIIAGTPQGSSISPILFNIYVNDIPRTSQSTICMFADDTAILAQSNELQLVTHFLHKHIAKLEDWFSTWKIALNVAKNRGPSSSHITSKRTTQVIPSQHTHTLV